jgi:glycosyltransferase involved in cell wall biosynthesis
VVAVGHSCVLSWFDQVKREGAPPRYQEYRRRVARGLRCASLIVAPSAAMLGFLQRFYGPLPACRVIHNAVRLESAPHEPKEPFVLAAGRFWDEAKNLSALDAAAVGVPWPICVAGDTTSPDGTIADGRSVQLLGSLPRNELHRWMARASIFAAPALYEPFGLGALEAARSGCALVLSDIASFRELWDGCAEFVDARDAGAIASALRRLASDPLRRAALAARAKARAETFDPQRMADAYLDAYRGVRHEPKGAAA